MFTKSVLKAVPVLVLMISLTSCASRTGSDASGEDGSTGSTGSADSSNDPLAFALFLTGDKNTATNCDIAFNEIMQTSNPGYAYSDRNSAVASCVAATQPTR